MADQNVDVKINNEERGKEVESDVRIVQVDMTCPRCDKGIMNVDENSPVLTTYPAQYSHVCNLCGYVQTYTTKYPYLKIIPDLTKLYINFKIKEG